MFSWWHTNTSRWDLKADILILNSCIGLFHPADETDGWGVVTLSVQTGETTVSHCRMKILLIHYLFDSYQLTKVQLINKYLNSEQGKHSQLEWFFTVVSVVVQFAVKRDGCTSSPVVRVVASCCWWEPHELSSIYLWPTGSDGDLEEVWPSPAVWNQMCGGALETISAVFATTKRAFLNQTMTCF